MSVNLTAGTAGVKPKDYRVYIDTYAIGFTPAVPAVKLTDIFISY